LESPEIRLKDRNGLSLRLVGVLKPTRALMKSLKGAGHDSDVGRELANLFRVLRYQNVNSIYIVGD
jgi:hypothetical protein